jgi:hypothetical protein
MSKDEPCPKALTCFLTVVNSQPEERRARLVIESLRAFGGDLKDSPVWVFVPGAYLPEGLSALQNVAVLPLEIGQPFGGYELADKVFACARAEELAGAQVRSLVWINLDCLIVNPPVLFAPHPACDAAFRPVHIRNVGSPASEPPDGYWAAVYRATGVDEASGTSESFVDRQVLRPYFNTHCFSIDPAMGILRAWRANFMTLVADRKFQADCCADELHRIFLHQVVLSALVTKRIERERIRMLPPEYSYPLHFQKQLDPSRRITQLDALVCAVYEEAGYLEGIEIREPLRSWLAAHRPDPID